LGPAETLTDLSNKLLRIADGLFAEDADILRAASDLIVCQVVERNDVLKALRLR
jgi:hypothetical protein